MASYTGFIPPDTHLYSGDYTTSPSGTYYGLSGGGFFWIVPGSNPAVAGCCTSGWTPTQDVSDTPSLGGYFAHMQTDGNFVLYTSATGTDTGTMVAVAATNSQQGGGPTSYYAQVLDNGNFQIGTGIGPANSSGSIYTATNPIGAVTGISLNTVTYNFDQAQFTSVTAIAAGHIDLANTTGISQQGIGQLNLSYSQSYSLSFSVADSVGESISATTTISLPGLAKEGLTIGISNQTTVTKGHADTTTSTIQWVAGFRPTVPALSTIRVDVSGVNASYEVPFDWTGVATYAGGATANVIGSGLFKGASQGNFQGTVSCLISVLPSHCDPGATYSLPITFAAVSEPGTVALFAFASVGAVLARRFRTRRGCPKGGWPASR